MNRKTLTVGLLAAVIVFVALAAIVLGPGVLQPQTSRPDSGNGGDMGDGNGGTGDDNGDGGTPPQDVPVETPTWDVGDSWTYNVSSSSEDPREFSDRDFGIRGEFTRTVTAIEDGTYNVSLAGAFRIIGFDPVEESLFESRSIMVVSDAYLNEATVGGYSLYRTEDLAKLADVRTIHLSGAIETEYGTYNVSYTKTTETTYDPAFDVWDFPLDENETWGASTNATIRVWIDWTIEGPNVDHEDSHNFTATVPVHLLLMSGELEDVETPAGTFASVPVKAGLPEIESAAPYGRLELLTGLGSDTWSDPHAFATAWFSGDVGNVVKVVVSAGDYRLDIVLVDYTNA